MENLHPENFMSYIEKANKFSIEDFEQARPIECMQRNSFEGFIMSSQVVYCSIILSLMEMEDILISLYSLYPQIVSCSFILAFTKTNHMF